jgi:capsular exopolysaccharide synthesis family protein
VDNLSLGQEGLRQHIDILKRRKFTLLLTVALCVGMSVYASYKQTPLYTSEARVLVRPLPGLVVGQTQIVNLSTESQVAASVPVASRVIRSLDLEQDEASLLSRLSVSPFVTDATPTDVMIISYTSPSAEGARELADAFARKYINYRQNQARHDLAVTQRAIEKRMFDLQEQLAEITRKQSRADRNGNLALTSTLDSQRNILLARLGVLEQRLQDVQPDKTIALGGGEVIQPASLPSRPSSPNHRQNIILGLMGGLALGIGLVLLRDRLDDRFKGRNDVISTLHAPVLATVPRYRLERTSGDVRSLRSVLLEDPLGAASEAYRALRTGLLYTATQTGRKAYLVTSAHASEGKTTTLVNLGVGLAQAGTSTVLVSADLRRPTLESLLGFSQDEGPGLSDCLQDRSIAFSDTIKRVIPNLHLVSCGRIPSNPSELLNSPRLPQFLEELETRFEMVLVDSPPVLAVTDSQILAPKLGGAVMVIDASRTRRTSATHAKDELERMGASIVGVVLNAFDKSSPYYSEYKANVYSGYSETPTEGNGAGKKKVETSRR